VNLEIGSTVGDYQIIEILGAGGMGKVFKVRNTISDRIEAMKVLLPDLAGEPDLADRFLREIKVLASLDHPNIAGLRTALRLDNQLLMVMELVEGKTLDQRLREGPLPVTEAARCINQVLSALAYAHGRGVIHRDIKPANMMQMTDGTVKLMDFGIAKGAGDSKLTMTGTTMGSLYYMSPEQIRGTQALDPRSDLYSVGVSLYELVTGKRPFDGDSQFAIMSAHLEKTPVPPITLDPHLPEALNDLILFSVGREPDARFQKAEAFQKALNSVVPGAATTVLLTPAAKASETPQPAPPPAPQAVPPAPAPRPAPAPAPAATRENRSHRALWATVGALCCVGILVAIIQFGPWKKAAADSVPPAPAAASAPAAAVPAPAPPLDQAAAVAASAPPPRTEPTPAPAPVQPVPTAVSPRPNRPSAAAPSPSPSSAPAAQAPTPAQAPAPVAEPAASPVQAPPQPDQSAQRAEMQKLRISLATMSARAASVHGTLQSLQRSQAASGLGLRGDWLQAASLMDSFIQGSNDALAAGDVPAAKDLMEKGERQLEKLEKALNK
jgi:serine/threonine-protein kinase